MKTALLLAASALALAAPAAAQTQPSSITADLNRAPAAAAQTPQTQPAQTRPTPPQATPAQSAPAPTPAPVRAAPQPVAPPAAQAEPEDAAEDEAAAVDAEAETGADAAAEPAVEPAPPPPPPLTAAQIAALPFRIDLPAGVGVVEGRSSETFDIWTVRRAGGPALVTIYAGERSDYPLYAGREITAGGRTSVVLDQGQGQRAMEHIFLRATAPREVHVWIGSVDDADIALAETIAQSVDPK